MMIFIVLLYRVYHGKVTDIFPTPFGKYTERLCCCSECKKYICILRKTNSSNNTRIFSLKHFCLSTKAKVMKSCLKFISKSVTDTNCNLQRHYINGLYAFTSRGIPLTALIICNSVQLYQTRYSRFRLGVVLFEAFALRRQLHL
ncbi:hypothetical protein HUJ05_000936 [Dendroctonus ponderosae]|nr:hypothetical protein HUJ05_000936 [Dendroctonus ponderosae]